MRQEGAVAQLGEHLLCKQGVVGSIPISSTRRWRAAGRVVVLGWDARLPGNQVAQVAQVAPASADLIGLFGSSLTTDSG